jgi:Tol biopolymer transport system component
VISANAPFGDARRVTFNDGDDTDPSWSPDGRRLAYTTSASNQRWIAVSEVIGGDRQLIRRGASSAAWSHDGSTIYALTAGPLPQDYNGNPRRLDEKDSTSPFLAANPQTS